MVFAIALQNIYRFVFIFFYFKGIFISILLTVADDSTQGISFEVKLNVHVLSLWIKAQ